MPRLYHFHFEGIEKPITIQTESKHMARAILQQRLPELPQYSGRDLQEETTEGLITGVTTRIKGGKKQVWDGQTWH